MKKNFIASVTCRSLHTQTHIACVRGFPMVPMVYHYRYANGTIGFPNGTIGVNGKPMVTIGKPMVPFATNGTVGKITNGTIGRTPNRAIESSIVKFTIVIYLFDQRLITVLRECIIFCSWSCNSGY